MTDIARLDAKIRRKQRYLARKHKGSVRHRRSLGQWTQLHHKRWLTGRILW